jgi:phospholipid/cholesterol/gamma-HCH transport system substrate-binding protein
MSVSRNARVALAVVLAIVLVGGLTQVLLRPVGTARATIVGYFQNTNGLFRGDDVRILGVTVGKIDAIEPEPSRAKVTFWVDRQYKIPAEAKAVIMSPSLVTARTIQLVPAYTDGPTMADGAVIPIGRTAVPVEWDDFRDQLQKLTATLQPTQPGGTSTFGALINTTADNLRGQGATLRDTVIKLSQAFSALGDHSNDIFTTIRNLSVFVSALQSSAGLLTELNGNLSAVTGLIANDPTAISNAVKDLHTAVSDVNTFIAQNREPIGTTTDRLASITTAVNDSLEDLKQSLHIAPSAFANVLNIYQPAQGAVVGALAVGNFANPISFLCGAIQAASRLGAEQSAKLCVQYLAPIIKNRQYNFPPIGISPFVGAQARPNEITYSEDWLRPDYVPPAGAVSAASDPAPADTAALPAQAPPPPEQPAPPPSPEPTSTDPTAGLSGLMVPGGGS